MITFPMLSDIAPEFGLTSKKNFYNFGRDNFTRLKAIMQKKLDFASLGGVRTNNFPSLLKPGPRYKNLQDFRERKLATLTFYGPEFSNLHAEAVNTHTIGLVINERPNQYYYKTPPEIVIMDSLGHVDTSIKRVHQSLIDDFISKEFPDARITITLRPQQTDTSLSCLTWTLANLEVAKEHLGRANILDLLPRPQHLPLILARQRKILLENRHLLNF